MSHGTPTKPKNVGSLPDEILLQVFQCLDVKDLISSNQVCQQWYKFTNDPFLWRELCAKKNYNYLIKRRVPPHWAVDHKERYKWFYRCSKSVHSLENKDYNLARFLTDKSTYEGEWYGNKRNGLGRMVFKTGSIYEGEWKEDKKDGYGIFIWSDSNFYEGEWRDDKKHGVGIRDWGDGECYDGEWRDDKQEGFGIYAWGDSSRYEGFNKDNKKHGRGSEVWANGDRFEGEYIEDCLHGWGIYQWHTGSRYEGEWKHNKMSGRGTCTWPSNSCYAGEWLDSQRHGYGRYTWPDGDAYEGEWQYGRRWGEGWLIKKDGKTYRQTWREIGSFDGSDKGKQVLGSDVDQYLEKRKRKFGPIMPMKDEGSEHAAIKKLRDEGDTTNFDQPGLL